LALFYGGAKEILKFCNNRPKEKSLHSGSKEEEKKIGVYKNTIFFWLKSIKSLGSINIFLRLSNLQGLNSILQILRPSAHNENH